MLTSPNMLPPGDAAVANGRKRASSAAGHTTTRLCPMARGGYTCPLLLGMSAHFTRKTGVSHQTPMQGVVAGPPARCWRVAHARSALACCSVHVPDAGAGARDEVDERTCVADKSDVHDADATDLAKLPAPRRPPINKSEPIGARDVTTTVNNAPRKANSAGRRRPLATLSPPPLVNRPLLLFSSRISTIVFRFRTPDAAADTVPPPRRSHPIIICIFIIFIFLSIFFLCFF